MSGPNAAMVGRRLHLQHGPIDLLIEAWGEADAVRAAYRRAAAAFDGVLDRLCDELPMLRSDIRDSPCVTGPVARRMMAAVAGHDGFVTPMAAVAGAVADHVLAAMRGGLLRKAMVNNGGDIALWLAEGETATLGIGHLQEQGATIRPVTLSASDAIGGVATSGWRGRSHSLGIADFVTVLARDAAAADVAATLIANAVDVPGCAAVQRQPAVELSPDSDLGARAVTVAVGPLCADEIARALASGTQVAEAMIGRGAIDSAWLGLQSSVLTVNSRVPSRILHESSLVSRMQKQTEKVG